MVADGMQVSYVGLADGGLAVGTQGRVLAGNGTQAHVVWHTGAHAGQVAPVYEADLREVPEPGLLDDSLDVPTPRLAVREAYDSQGGPGALAALDAAGALAGMPQVAEEVADFARARVRKDGALGQALAQLDPEEADYVVGLVASDCIKEALGG